jgi:hypothetical protein
MGLNDYKVILNGFGLENSQPKVYKPSAGRGLPTSGGNYSVMGEEVGDALGLTNLAKDFSLLGTPVFSSLMFLPGTFMVKKGKLTIPVPYGGLMLETVLINISMTKRIQFTEIQGRQGTVKEFISNGDFNVNIKGSLVDPNSNRYPIEQVALLRAICEAPETINVASAFLGLFSITGLVIQSYSFSQSEGYHNVQLFDLNCISDRPIELKAKGLL